MTKEPESIDEVLNELNAARGPNDNYDKFIAVLPDEFASTDDLEFRALRVVEKTALALQAACLLRYAPEFVAEAFCGSRLMENYLSFGSLPVGVEVKKVIERARPESQNRER
jgi:putative acyl-CoA dehydrogenase